MMKYLKLHWWNSSWFDFSVKDKIIWEKSRNDVEKSKSWATQHSAIAVRWYGLVTLTSAWVCSACKLYVSLHACTHQHATHIHTLTFSTHTNRWSRAGPVTPSAPHPSPPMIHVSEFWDLRDLTWDCAGGAEGSDYLSLSMSISVGPIPPSAVPLSPQASHASPPPHVILICAANYTLPAFLPRR